MRKELKTLKDFEIPTCQDVCPDPCEGAKNLRETLRQEAIEWVKELLKLEKELLRMLYQPSSVKEFYYGDQPVDDKLEQTIGKIQVLAEFFNITEEELKEMGFKIIGDEK